MPDETPDTCSAKWLGGPVTIPSLASGEINHGDVVDGVPRGEAAESVYWEIVKPKKVTS